MYHLQTGYGTRLRSWLIHLKGGVRSCSDRRMTYLGSSKFMQRHIKFTSTLNNDPALNPDNDLFACNNSIG